MKTAKFVAGALVVAVLAASGDLRAAGQLSTIRTTHYQVHTDIEDRALVQDLCRRMDAMYEEYQRRLSGFRVESGTPVMEVYLFQRQQDYLRFTGDRWRNSGGVYMTGRNRLAAFLEGQGRDGLRRTLQHEAFHQFAHVAINPHLPAWLNEGIAQVFEEGIWTGSGFVLGQVPPRRIRQLEADIENRRLVPFERMMSLTHEQWTTTLAGDAVAGATQYNQAWAMVHFLVQARDAAGKEKYRGRLVHMLDLLHRGKEPKEAFDTAFAGNVKGFQQRFVEYALTLSATPEASMIERQEILADLLIELKNQGRSCERMEDLREVAIGAQYARQYSDRRVTWSTDPDVITYFSDHQGRVFDGRELFFSGRIGAPLPDLVCRASDRLTLRTRFYASRAGKLEREVLVESPNAQARAED